MHIGLTKNSYAIICSGLDAKPALVVVRGYTLNYKGFRLGIHRQDCRVGRNKYEYVLTDLASGLAIFHSPRKMYIIDELERDIPTERLQKYLDLTKKDFYRERVEIFKTMKRGGKPDEK